MPFRVSIFSQQQSTKLAGWSINFWNLSSDQSVVSGRALALQGAINNAMAAQAIVTAVRISSYPANRLPLNIPVASTPAAPSTNNDADYPTNAIQLVLRGLPTYKAIVWLSGVPDSIITLSGRYVPTPDWTPRINAVLGLLTNSANEWGLHVLNRATPIKTVTNLVTATGVLTVPAHGWGAAGVVTRIRVRGFAKPRAANQVWRVTVIDENSVQLNFWTGLSDPQIQGNNPVAQQQLFTDVAISSATTGAASKHNRGRPIGLLGGRRRTRAS